MLSHSSLETFIARRTTFCSLHCIIHRQRVKKPQGTDVVVVVVTITVHNCAVSQLGDRTHTHAAPQGRSLLTRERCSGVRSICRVVLQFGVAWSGWLADRMSICSLHLISCVWNKLRSQQRTVHSRAAVHANKLVVFGLRSHCASRVHAGKWQAN